MRAIRKPFQDVTWQRYQTSFPRYTLDATPRAL
nr:transposase [Caldibacillus debilis]